MQTEEISNGIYKTILVPLAKKLGVHPIVLIEEIYNQYGQVRTSPNVVSGLFLKEKMMLDHCILKVLMKKVVVLYSKTTNITTSLCVLTICFWMEHTKST